MSNYLQKMLSRSTRQYEPEHSELSLANALKELTTQEFQKLKRDSVDSPQEIISNIDLRLLSVETKLEVIEKSNVQLKNECVELRAGLAQTDKQLMI